MSNYSVEVIGFERLSHSLEETVRQSADLLETKDELREEYFAQNRENLLGEGALTDGWAPLTEATERDKARKGHGGKRTEERTGDLFRSLTEEGAAGFFERATSTEIAWGSNLPYALAQHAGVPSRNLPARPLMPSRRKAEAYERVMHKHAAEVAAANGFYA